MRSGMRRQRKRSVLVACEGRSERGYIRWLSHLARIHDLPISLKAEDMKGGPPATVAKKAVEFLEGNIVKSGTYRGKYLILDRDPSVNTASDLDQAEKIARKHSFGIVWQPVCHECFLLKHFERTERLNPLTAKACNEALRSVWPDYRKGMDALGYESRMGIEDLARGRANLPDLDTFLNDIGWN